jgi:hypothetical protein
MATAQQQAEALLNDIDSLGATPAASLTPTKPGALQGNAIEAIEFLDEITKSSPKPKLVAPSLARPSSRATERISLKTKIPEAPAPPPPTAVEPPVASQSTPWGWGSVWSSASAAIQQAKTVVDEGVKNLPQVTQSDQPRQWREGLIDYVKSAQLDKIGIGSDSCICHSCILTVWSSRPGFKDRVPFDTDRYSERCGTPYCST